ncbi:MAG: lytic murein transglycosylase [Oceanicaulis sp.]
MISTLMRNAGLAALAIACASCAGVPAATASDGAARSVGAATATTTTMAQADGFDTWLSRFRTELADDGVSEDIIASMLDGLQPNPVVLERDAYQPEFVRPVWQYLQGAVSEQRISQGRAAQGRVLSTLEEIEAEYGVDKDILTGIWGLESAYGVIQGDFDIVRSLATLAWDGRRRDFAESQLKAIAQMIARGYATREQLEGSWAGAMGQTQFIPTTYMERAVDFDGDGRRNIWDSEGDALASAANLLARAGWDRDEPVVEEVNLPQGFDFEAWSERSRLSVSQWAAQGVAPASGSFDGVEALQARILLPAGGGGPAFIAFSNFDTLLRYNNSTSYALGVSYLAKALEGSGALPGGWPEGDPPLGRDHARDLQAALTALGFDTQGIDGVVGPNTRNALRAFQQSKGLEPDGYAGAAAYEQVIGSPPVAEDE